MRDWRSCDLCVRASLRSISHAPHPHSLLFHRLATVRPIVLFSHLYPSTTILRYPPSYIYVVVVDGDVAGDEPTISDDATPIVRSYVCFTIEMTLDVRRYRRHRLHT